VEPITVGRNKPYINRSSLHRERDIKMPPRRRRREKGRKERVMQRIGGCQMDFIGFFPLFSLLFSSF
jgi:hypothetical protein